VQMKVLVAVVVATVLLGGCASTGSTLPDVPSTIVPTDTPTDGGSSTSTTVADVEEAEETTTTTVFGRPVAAPTEAPPFEEVTITSEDGVDLYAQFWEGGDIAVVYTHKYDAAAAGGGGVRPPQSSATVAPSTWALAEHSLTVLAIDFRGHGLSEGTYNVKESQLDMRAAYRFLTDRGFTTIVGMAFGGSAPVMADLSAKDPDFDLAGLGMLFTPLAETGFDGKTALSALDEPVWLVGIDVGSFGGVTKRLEPSVQNLYDRTIFPPVPSGLQFADVYGPEYLGRQLDFIEAVTNR